MGQCFQEGSGDQKLQFSPSGTQAWRENKKGVWNNPTTNSLSSCQAAPALPAPLPPRLRLPHSLNDCLLSTCYVITLCLDWRYKWEVKQAWSPQLLEPTEHRETDIDQVHKEPSR